MQFIGNQLKDIKAEGKYITIGNVTKWFKFKVLFFSLDSLSASYLLGLKSSFNHTYCCRFCDIKRPDFSKCFYQNETLLRTSQSFKTRYNESILINESVFGISRPCLLDFFPVDDISTMCQPCFAHDILEGIGPKIFRFCLTQLKDTAMIDIQRLEPFLNSFPLKGNDKLKFPKLFLDNISSNRFVAYECFELFRFLPFILKEQNLCEDDNYFKLLLLLSQIILYVMKIRFTADDLIFLDNLIASFLELCSSICPTLVTIKFHHLVHYSSYIIRYGPPRLFSTLSFEQLHSDLKTLLRSSKNWKNQCLTISKKYARMRAINPSEQFLNYNNEFEVTVPEFLNECENVKGVESVEYFNFTYKKNTVIEFSRSNLNLKFMEIKQLFRSDNKLYFQGDIFEGFYNPEFNFVELNYLNTNGNVDFDTVIKNPCTYIK